MCTSVQVCRIQMGLFLKKFIFLQLNTKNPLQITYKQDERFYSSLVERNRKHLCVSLFLLSHNLYEKYHMQESMVKDVEEKSSFFRRRYGSKCHIKAIVSLIFTH